MVYTVHGNHQLISSPVSVSSLSYLDAPRGTILCGRHFMLMRLNLHGSLQSLRDGDEHIEGWRASATWEPSLRSANKGVKHTPQGLLLLLFCEYAKEANLTAEDSEGEINWLLLFLLFSWNSSEARTFWQTVCTFCFFSGPSKRFWGIRLVHKTNIIFVWFNNTYRMVASSKTCLHYVEHSFESPSYFLTLRVSFIFYLALWFGIFLFLFIINKSSHPQTKGYIRSFAFMFFYMKS